MNQVLNTLIISANATLVALLFWRRINRTLPAFTLLICYWFLIELALSGLDYLPAPLKPYPRFYDFLSLIGDAILIAVLSELIWRVFCSSTLFVTPPSPLIVVIFIILLGWSIWPPHPLCFTTASKANRFNKPNLCAGNSNQSPGYPQFPQQNLAYDSMNSA